MTKKKTVRPIDPEKLANLAVAVGVVLPTLNELYGAGALPAGLLPSAVGRLVAAYALAVVEMDRYWTEVEKAK